MLALLFAAFFFIFMGGIFLYVLPAIISWWILFTKAGRPGWAAIVPVYNVVVMADIGQQPSWMGWTAGVASILPSVFGRNGGLVGLISLVGLVLSIMLIVKMSKRYDRDAGFWFLLVLLPIVAVFMVDKAKYRGGRR